jgi:drug/metabolite transporter (DMT)-like permease
MSASMLAFVLNDGLMKLLFIDWSIYQAIFLRGILTIPVMLFIAWSRDQLFIKISSRDWKFILIRTVSEVGAAIFFLSALAHMPLANVTAILQALPLVVTMAAALFLGESVRWRRWMAICAGFIGVLIIIRPGLEGFSIYSLSALGAVICVTVRDLTTSRLSPEVPSMFVALITGVAITGLGAMLLPTTIWAPINGSHWIILSVASIAIIFGYLFSVMAMRYGETAFIAPFRYTAMLWAIIFGILFFKDWPDEFTVIGTTIIVIAGVYSFHRERLQKVSNIGTGN